jgi:hypothetical protein
MPTPTAMFRKTRSSSLIIARCSRLTLEAAQPLPRACLDRSATPSLKIPTWGSATRERELLNFLHWAASVAPHFVDVKTKWDPQPASITEADNRAETTCVD